MPMPQPQIPQQPSSISVEKRKHAPFLKASPALLEAMIEEEGARQTVYRDVAGYPTVGVGHLVTPEDGLQVGDRISKDKVLDFLERDIAIAERAVARLVGDLPLFQNEFDALVDLVFNVGEGNVSAERSPRLNTAIAHADYDAIAEELGYHHARGRIAKGLVHRSERRANIFMDASYADPRESAGGGSVA
jgi:GH24 family phage-related lysozyme (muramidase)